MSPKFSHVDLYKKDPKENLTQEKRHCDHGGRNWSDAPTSQGMLATRSF